MCISNPHETNDFRWKVTSLYTSHTITSSTDVRSMQCRTACRTIASLRSKASRCGCHSSGVTGSADSDSSISADSGFSPLCKLPANVNLFLRLCRDVSTAPSNVYLKSDFSVVPRIIQHCRNGAAMLRSSWNACPKDLPWSYRTTNVSVPNGLKCPTKAILNYSTISLPMPWMHALTWTGRNDVGRCFRS